MSKNPKTPASQPDKGMALYIPTPCHENWHSMTPVEQGRFCQSCAKEVVDFSLMTDQEVLNYFNKSTGGTCGRFNNDQLHRPLQPTKIEKKRAWWIAIMMPLLVLFEKAGAQRKLHHRRVDYTKTVKNKAPHILGMVLSQPEIPQNIKGIVISAADRKPVAFAVIKVNGEFIGVADSIGRFNVTLDGVSAYRGTIEASADGYKTGGNAYLSTDMKDYTIALQEEKIKLEDIEIPALVDTIQSAQSTDFIIDSALTYEGLKFDEVAITKVLDSAFYCQTVGFTITATPVLKVPLKDTLVNIFTNPVIIYPNPAQRGSNVTITFKDEGDYNIQVFDNSGKLVIINNCSAVKAAPQVPLNIPALLPAGTYYVRTINKRNKKQYTSKLIVM